MWGTCNRILLCATMLQVSDISYFPGMTLIILVAVFVCIDFGLPVVSIYTTCTVHDCGCRRRYGWNVGRILPKSLHLFHCFVTCATTRIVEWLLRDTI